MERIAENSRAGIDAALRDFTTHMRHKLLLTRHRTHWAADDDMFFVKRAREELDELEQAIRAGDRKEIVREAADAANFCMMIADNAQWAGTRSAYSHEGA